MILRRAVFLVLVVTMGVACSLALDWSEADLPCDEGGACADGFSCLVNRCVEVGSLPLNATCTEPEQCEGDLTCGSEQPFTCRRICHALLAPTGNCQSGEYCRPESAHDSPDRWMGTCVASECVRDDDCSPDRICVPITGNARACLLQCSYSFPSGYQDNCGSTYSEEQYCQLIGTEAGRNIVCLEALTDNASRPGEGAPCEPVDNPCQRSLVCLQNVCRRFCSTDPPIACPGTEVCTTVENDNGNVMQACQ